MECEVKPMKPDVFFNDVSLFSMGWLRESVDFPVPLSQSESLVVPGRSAPLRFTQALGKVSFQPRSFTITLSMCGTRARFDALVSTTVNRFAGQLVKVVRTEDKSVYAIGTLEAESSYDPRTYKGVLVFSSKDADAYLYHVQETTKSLTGSGTLSLANDFMPVMPSITTTAETTLAWQAGADAFTKTLSAGTWTVPELELAPGDNTITVTGTGTITFTYREGRL